MAHAVFKRLRVQRDQQIIWLCRSERDSSQDVIEYYNASRRDAKTPRLFLQIVYCPGYAVSPIPLYLIFCHDYLFSLREKLFNPLSYMKI